VGTRGGVIIRDRLARPFEWLLWARELRWWFLGALVAWIVMHLVSQGYGVNLKVGWDIGRGASGEIVLIPTTPRPPHGLPEE
jgi:hypothetical protein